jgi:hypothetical protein
MMYHNYRKTKAELCKAVILLTPAAPWLGDAIFDDFSSSRICQGMSFSEDIIVE